MAKGVGTLLEKWQLFHVIPFSFLLLSSLSSITTKIAMQRVVSFSVLPTSEKCAELAGQCLPLPPEGLLWAGAPSTGNPKVTSSCKMPFIALRGIRENFKCECEPVFGILLLCWQWCQKWLCMGLVTIKRNLRECNDNWLFSYHMRIALILHFYLFLVKIAYLFNMHTYL